MTIKRDVHWHRRHAKKLKKYKLKHKSVQIEPIMPLLVKKFEKMEQKKISISTRLANMFRGIIAK